MKTITLVLLASILISSCGKPGGRDGRACRTLEEQRAICFVEEMEKLGHDRNMTNWVKDYCARVYATQGCY